MPVLHQPSSLCPPQFSKLHSHKVFPLVAAFSHPPPPHVTTSGWKHCFCVPGVFLQDNVFLFNFTSLMDMALLGEGRVVCAVLGRQGGYLVLPTAARVQYAVSINGPLHCFVTKRPLI